jgi:hypothetical protein
MPNKHPETKQQNSENLKAIVAKVDFYETELAKGENPTGPATVARAEVYDAFDNAEISELEEVRDVCVRLFKILGIYERIFLCGVHTKVVVKIAYGFGMR